jgi:uncharacterized protein (DUF1778 family)
VGFSFDDGRDKLRLNPVQDWLWKRSEDARKSSYNDFALNKATMAACLFQIDGARLPLGQRA